MKIAVAPTVMALDAALYRRVPTPRVAASVLLVCLGVAVATVTDTHMARNARGLAVGLAATLVTAMYQIWAGTKQKELRASSMQLLHQYTPQAAAILGLLVPIMEPVGWGHLRGGAVAAAAGAGVWGDGTLLGYNFTPAAAAAIVLSAVLGLLVSLSTFLVIGATSSLTYNVVVGLGMGSASDDRGGRSVGF
jgi:solute carrier family 35 protein E3